jgi:hypothetical protein
MIPARSGQGKAKGLTACVRRHRQSCSPRRPFWGLDLVHA